MSTLLLRGGGVVEDVNVSVATLNRLLDMPEAERPRWLSVTWSPSFTPHNPQSFKVNVLLDEVIGVRESGR